MVDTLIKHDTKWLAPAAIWSEFSDISTAEKRDDFKRPTILRFNSDAFMQELISLMNLYPERLVEWKAQGETWREPMETPPTRELLPIEQPVSEFLKSQTKQLKIENKISVPSSTNLVVNNKLPLKLFQPLHQRFYLVTASLVCRRVGLPDRAIDLEKDQKVKFVIRRLLPKDPNAEIENPDVCDPQNCDEYAWVLDGDQMKWKKVVEGSVINTKTLLTEEERLPMSPLGYIEEGEQSRKLLSGFIPVSKREIYMNSGLVVAEPKEENQNSSVNSSKHDAIAHVFSMLVAAPWKRLISMGLNESNGNSKWVSEAPASAKNHDEFPDFDLISGSTLRDTREKIQTISWYVLIDMLQFFKDYIPRIYQYIADGIEPAALSQEELNLYNALSAITLNTEDFNDKVIDGVQDNYISESNYHTHNDLKGSLVAALSELANNSNYETDLDLVDYAYDRIDENTKAEYNWPDFLFPLADPVIAACPLPSILADDDPDRSDAEPDFSHDQLDALTLLVKEAIPEDLGKTAPDIKPPKPPQKDNSGGWFVIRCVFEAPNCGPFNPALLSESTVPFKMAATYDPDAPGRPINIPMPLDITPAGLRKHQKNANFMISDMLCGKLRGARKTTLGDLVLSVLPWPFHKDLPEPGNANCSKGGIGFGMMCSLSIPIVTLCAMILLTIMVTLFDIFFRWLPFFFLCLPIPGLKGKK